VAFAYPHDSARDEYMQGFGPHFMNSGCILGRAQQVRELVSHAHAMATTVDDDQQIFVRYHLTHPGRISIDVENVFALTGYREGFPHFETNITVSPLLEFDVLRGMDLVAGSKGHKEHAASFGGQGSDTELIADSNVGPDAEAHAGLAGLSSDYSHPRYGIPVLHCNNMKAHTMCARVITLITERYDQFYSGSTDKEECLHAMDLFHSQRYIDCVGFIFQNDALRSNMTSEGGTNGLADYLLERIAGLV
jgi:hypothetical protein